MKVIIIGGVAGGASCAARLRRLDEQAEIIIFERSGHVSFANCGLPYHLSEVIEERQQLLLQTPTSLWNRFHLKVKVRHEVLAINRETKTVTVMDLETQAIFEESYDKLVLAPGASPVLPPLPGIEKAVTLRNIEDMDRIRARLKEHPGAQVVIAGAGFIGLEVAENLREVGCKVQVVELSQQVLPPLDPEMAALVAQEVRQHGVDLNLGVSLAAIHDDSAELSDGRKLPADFVLMAVGVRPETSLARMAALTIGVRGGIHVNAQLQTSDPDVYAVGDAVEKIEPLTGEASLVPLAWASNRQGRLVADHLCGQDILWQPTLGTAIVKVFDLTAAVTGSNEKRLRQLGLPYQAIYLHPNSHASYYPGAHTMSLKLLFHPQTGQIYGAQGVGAEGIDKQIDVLATAMHSGMTAPQLAELELAYAPPYGSAKAPVNMLGYVAENVIQGQTRICTWDTLQTVSQERTLVDVRDAKEFQSGHIPGALNIPLNDLRERHGELPAKSLVVYCQVGLRGHVATRLLTQLGFDVINLSGGYQTWKALTKTGA